METFGWSQLYKLELSASERKLGDSCRNCGMPPAGLVCTAQGPVDWVVLSFLIAFKLPCYPLGWLLCFFFFFSSLLLPTGARSLPLDYIN